MTVLAILSELGVAATAKAGPHERRLRKELFFAEQELAKAETEAVGKEVIVTVATIRVYKARFADTGDPRFLDLIADATAKLAVLTSELEDLEARAKELRQLIKVLRPLLEAITGSISVRGGSIGPIGT